MLTCNFFARNQQKHHLAVESWSFKEAATFGSRSTEEFCATRGILRAPFEVLVISSDNTNQMVYFSHVKMYNENVSLSVRSKGHFLGP